MKLNKILTTTENLNHDQRWQYMISLGKDSINNKTIASLLYELSISEIHYERMLALMSAHGSFNVKIIANLVEDPSSIGIGKAITLAAKYLDSDLLVKLIPVLSKNKRTNIAFALLKNGRTNIIETVFSQFDDCIQDELLFYTSEIFFKKHIKLNEIEGFTSIQWKDIAKRFPDFASEQLEKIITKPGEPHWLIKQAIHSVLHQFYKTKPNMGLKLLENAFDLINHQTEIVKMYSCIFPEAVAKILLNQSLNNAFNLPVTMLRKLQNDVLCALAEKNIIKNLNSVFSKLYPKQRMALYKKLNESLRNKYGELPLFYAKSLDKQSRELEALHAFNLKILEAYPKQRLPYLSLIPFAQAFPLAKPFIFQLDGELRAAAILALVQCGNYNSEELDDILDFCLKRENEQDPVRLAMMTALANLSPSRWTVDHLPKLSLIINASLNARDCSFGTMEMVAKILLKMITFQTDFVIDELPKFAERMGKLYFISLESCITDAEMIKLDACLFPLIDTWIKRNFIRSAVSLIASFGCRIKSAQKQNPNKRLNLVQSLINLTNDKRGYVASLGLDTLVDLHLTDEVKILIPKLLQQDSSWIQVYNVSQYLNRRHQNLLTPFLVARVYKNRFSSGKTPTLLGLDYGFIRWTKNQQDIYANSLNAIMTSTKRNVSELYKCVERISAMPSANLDPLINLAKVDSTDIALRDKAIEALGRADGGRGVITLIQALDDNRARVAIYALRRSIINMPEKTAISLLYKVPRSKITVIKETIYLAGEFSGDDSYNFLNSISKEENLHQDVQIALLRAFWKHLNKEEVWGHFNKAAQSNSFSLARSTINIPQDGLTQISKHHLCEQMTLLIKNENAQIRLETLRRLVSMPLNKVDNNLFKALANMLEDIDANICTLAAEAMLLCYISTNKNDLVEAFSNITCQKSIVGIVQAFTNKKYVNIDDLKNCAESFLYAIIKQRRFPTQALKLSVCLLSPTKIILVIEDMIKNDLLHEGVIEANHSNWNRAIKNYSYDCMKELEEKLRLSKHEKFRRLGLGLLIQLSNQYGWTKEHCKLIVQYCSDPSLWISETADAIELPETLLDESFN